MKGTLNWVSQLHLGKPPFWELIRRNSEMVFNSAKDHIAR